ncbi:hypothetical protein MIR68_006916 [Amoeboaphelidium protococcarum]|nr:hypothetical protein MIR68_006916 [Amoeboaphelidium protococcarum]
MLQKELLEPRIGKLLTINLSVREFDLDAMVLAANEELIVDNPTMTKKLGSYTNAVADFRPVKRVFESRRRMSSDENLLMMDLEYQLSYTVSRWPLFKNTVYAAAFFPQQFSASKSCYKGNYFGRNKPGHSAKYCRALYWMFKFLKHPVGHSFDTYRDRKRRGIRSGQQNIRNRQNGSSRAINKDDHTAILVSLSNEPLEISVSDQTYESAGYCLILDSGCSMHMVNYCTLLSGVQREGWWIGVADGRRLQAIGGGNLDCCVDGRALKFTNVLRVPSLNFYLLSIKQITAKGVYVMITEYNCQVEKNGLQVVALKERNVYVMRFDQDQSRVHGQSVARNTQHWSSDQQHLALPWHSCLGRVGRYNVAILCSLHHQQLGQNLSAQHSASSCALQCSSWVTRIKRMKSSTQADKRCQYCWLNRQVLICCFIENTSIEFYICRQWLALQLRGVLS